MEAVILAGGKGTRLRPFTATIPKPLLPLGDVPILEVVLRQLARAGFTRIQITLNHMAPLFSALLGDGRDMGVEIEYVLEDEPLGTAGSLRLLRDLPDHFLVMNGDILTTLDYGAFHAWHRERDSMASVAVAERVVDINYGVLEVGSDGRMTDYREKPSLSYSVSMGVYMLSRESMQFIPESGPFDMPSLFSAAHERTGRVFCHSPKCYWQDIGRVDDYQRAGNDFQENPERFLGAQPARPI